MPSSLMTKPCSLGCICPPPQGFIEVAYRYYLLHIVLSQLLPDNDSTPPHQIFCYLGFLLIIFAYKAIAAPILVNVYRYPFHIVLSPKLRLQHTPPPNEICEGVLLVLPLQCPARTIRVRIGRNQFFSYFHFLCLI